MTTNKPISLNLIGNRGFLFNGNDYLTLRTEHRIVGNLIGCDVNNPRSTAIGGLPAIFSPIEVRFLVEKGFAVIRNTSDLKQPPTEEISQQYSKFLDNQLQEQREILRKRKISELQDNLEKIVQGKRKKLLKSGLREEDINLDSGKILQEEIDKIPELQLENLLIQTPTEHPFPRMREETRETQELPEFQEEEELKYQVFCDLWEKGNFLTSGSTFGGDFLIYPSDPLIVHASQVVHVLKESQMDTRKFISCNRLCVGVKKSCVFAYREPSGSIAYLTSQWEGNF
uniref:tRNA-splicing endonuclease subunit Sen34 n=1 Tax=Phlebotomus papatasi TaxID=29031 RepID=A0A1B0DJ44_PHLPP